MHRFLVATVTLAVTTLAACGATTSRGAEAPESEVERYVSSALEKEIGIKPDKIDCPSGLRLKVGEQMRCTLTHENDSTGLTVTMSDVDGAEFHLDAEVDEKGTIVAKGDLEAAIADKLEEQTGERPAAVECPGPSNRVLGSRLSASSLAPVVTATVPRST